MQVEFSAWEYCSDDTFRKSEYSFEGDFASGWTIERNGKEYLTLSSGYRLLEVDSCGVCSTDLDRRFLPFPLPQIIGHEVVARDLESAQECVVEINDTLLARGSKNLDIYCESGLANHSPERKVLGIDRLPGGFGPYLLAPENAIRKIGDVSSRVAVLTEPFAAALHAARTSLPHSGEKIAVLGPRRLGMLVVAALSALKRDTDFDLTAISRHSKLLGLAQELGSDHIVKLSDNYQLPEFAKFDRVFDTTGSPAGLELACQLAIREIHLKSTNGQSFQGIQHLTEMVVDEISLLPLQANSWNFSWIDGQNERDWVYCSDPNGIDIPSSFRVFSGTPQDALNFLRSSTEFDKRVPRFRFALARNSQEIDQIIRPEKGTEESLVLPRSAILWAGPSNSGNDLLDFVFRGGRIRTSRCGDFSDALEMLAKNPRIAGILEDKLITHSYTADNIQNAFQTARNKDSIKVVIRHNKK